jgi:hypothetical protein
MIEMQKSERFDNIALKIIDYQEKHHMTDAEFALASHFTVEKIHGFKSMTGAAPTQEEETALERFMRTNSVRA